MPGSEIYFERRMTMWLVYICIGFNIFLGAASIWVQLQDYPGQFRNHKLLKEWEEEEKAKRN